MPIVSIPSKKGLSTDYSMLLEIKRKRAINAVQQAKDPKGDQTKKPFIREGMMQKGSQTGAIEYYLIPSLQGLSYVPKF